MSAKINYDPAFDANGNKMWKVTGWEGVKKLEELPKEYAVNVEKADAFYERNLIFFPKDLKVVSSRDKLDHGDPVPHIIILEPGTLVTPDQRIAIKRTMDRAKDRLSAILKKQREEARPVHANISFTMWCEMFRIASEECFKNLAANEKSAEDREREEWLAQGTQTDEV